MQKKILIIRHIGIEGPGTFGRFLEENKMPYEILDMYKFSAPVLSFPGLSDFCGIIILGGPMNVYEEEKHPFLRAEKALIKEALGKNVPMIGICLGGQLIASCLGAAVRPAALKEIGWFDVVFESCAKNDAIFKNFGPEAKVFQWHEDAFDLPPGSVLLAKSNGINQAFRFGNFVWGIQFHIEVDEEMIKSWSGEYIKGGFFKPTCPDMLAEYRDNALEFREKAGRVYSAFLDVVNRNHGQK